MKSRFFLGTVAVILSASTFACGAAPTGHATDASHANAVGPDENPADTHQLVSLTSATESGKLVDGPLQGSATANAASASK